METVSISASRRTTRTRSSIGSSVPTFLIIPPSRGTAGSWAGTRFLPAPDGRESFGQGPLAQQILWETEDSSTRRRGHLFWISLGNIPYNSLGQYGWGKFGFLTNNRWQFSDDLSWVKGKHTIKVGYEYRWHQFPFSGWANGNQGGEFRFDRRETGGYDSTGNLIANSGESFASFLLGQVDSSTQNIPFHPMFYEAYMSPWINDEYKATSRLTLTLGLRFDYQFARTETQDRYSSFDPNTPNPAAGNLPGALLFAGKGTGRTGQRTFEHPAHDAWGPRLGFAYRVNDKTALRGGYGIYYSGISFDQFIGQPTLGYVSNPTVSNISNGEHPAFLLDNGFPAN